jgi:glycolate oxidase
VAIGRTLRPSMLELMDGASINAVEDYRPMGLDRAAGALLIAQSDAPAGAAAEEVAAIEAACVAAGSSDVFLTDDPEEGELFTAARRLAFPAVEARGSLMLEDVGVPVPLLPELVDGIAKIAESLGLEVPVVAHAGDGNTHPTIVFDPADADAAGRAQQAFEQIMTLALSLGGTITGEHGVGRTKKGTLPAQLGADVMALSHRIKHALDPEGILNPGAVL